jgi:hypothetical protein
MPRRNDIAKILIIGSGTERRLALITVFFSFVLLLARAHACSRSFARVFVSSDFHVIVRHGPTPVPGVQVQVYDTAELHRDNTSAEWKPVLTLITAQDGAAEIKGLTKGIYLVGTKGPGGGSATYVEISDKSIEKSDQISLQWPYSMNGTLKTRALSGELLTNDPWKPFETLRVELWHAGAEKPLAVVEAGPQGRFHFDEVRPGAYVVRVLGNQNNVRRDDQIKGDLSVELAPSAPDALASLALRLDETTCGIQYSRCGVNETPIATGSRRVKVLYQPGMAEFPLVENAKYKLLDQHGASIAEGTTDHEGNAELPSEFVGKATLLVASPLLTTIQQELDLLPPDGHAPDLVVTMVPIVGGDSQCSTVSLEKHATPQ